MLAWLKEWDMVVFPKANAVVKPAFANPDFEVASLSRPYLTQYLIQWFSKSTTPQNL